LDAGCYQVVLRADGCQALAVSLSPLVEETELQPVELPCSPHRRAVTDGVWVPLAGRARASASAVPRPFEITGRVVQAPSGRPVAGALVWTGEHPTSAPARTDDEGRFRLLAAADETIRLSAAATGFLALDRQPLPRRAGPLETTLRLRPAARLVGRVVDSRGVPVAGASLDALPGGRTVWSRPDGRFRLSGLLPRGTYELSVSKTGFPPTREPARTGAAGEEPAPLRIVLGENQRARGRVLDREGRPVAGAELTLATQSEDLWGEEPTGVATSDARGAFELRDLAPGRFVLHAAHPGFAPTRRADIEIGSGPAAADLGVVVLESGAALEGVVTDHGGSPIAGARVQLNAPLIPLRAEIGIADDPALQTFATADSDGHFRFADLPHGAQFDLTVEHPGYAPAQLARVAAPTPEPLRIKLGVGRSLAGRVVGPRGEPVPGARVVPSEKVGPGGFRVIGLAHADARGAFRLVELAPGTVHLEISADGYRTRRTEGIPILEDRDVEGLELTLEQGASLAGRVLDARGDPVAGARVGAAAEGQPPVGVSFDYHLPVETDGEGRWSIEGLEPGRVQVQADHPRGRARAHLRLEPGENHLDLTLPPGVEVAGQVSDEADGPLPAAGLQLTSTGTRESYDTVSAADGTFLFPGVPDGEFVLRASRSGYAEATYPGGIRIAGQPVGGLALHLTRLRSATLTGRLLGLEPDEWAGAHVSAWCEGQSFPGSVGRDGRYRIAGVWAGDCQVQAATASGNSAEGSVRVEPAAAEAVLDLEFQSGFTLSGRVVVDGKPLAGAVVLVRAAPGTPLPHPAESLANTAYDGSFSLAHVKPGPHVLEVLGRDHFEYSQPVEVTADRTVEIQVTTGRDHGPAHDPV
jgi:protocatechuate 3,4-dioxygenase beta subunit